MANQIDDHIQTRQWLSLPVHRNVVEQPVFDLVPLTRARWEMAHVNRQATFIRKFLQTIFPKAVATAIAPATVRSDEKAFRVRIKLLAQVFVPAPDRFHRKLRRVMVKASGYGLQTSGKRMEHQTLKPEV